MFGLAIKDKNLRNTGLKTELYGLFISAGVGTETVMFLFFTMLELLVEN